MLDHVHFDARQIPVADMVYDAWAIDLPDGKLWARCYVTRDSSKSNASRLPALSTLQDRSPVRLSKLDDHDTTARKLMGLNTIRIMQPWANGRADRGNSSMASRERR